MIICNIPVKVTQTLTILNDWRKRYFYKNTGLNRDAKVALIYFSYEPDFEYLYLSLKSATQFIDNDLVKSIFIFIDQKKPFTQEQQSALHKLNNKVQFKPIYNFSWASTETTLAELGAFKTVADTLNNEDLLAKVDSDILFMQSDRLQSLLTSDYNAIGDGHHVDYKYAQGGLYFIRKKLFHEKLEPLIDRKSIEAAEDSINNKGEDIVISELLRSTGNPYYLTRFMLFPDEYSKTKIFSAALRKEFFSLHFVKDKQKMPTLIEKMALQ